MKFYWENLILKDESLWLGRGHCDKQIKGNQYIYGFIREKKESLIALLVGTVTI